MASFPQASPPTPCAHLYPPPYALHALPISLVSILPPAQYWVRSTDHSALRVRCYLPLSISVTLSIFTFTPIPILFTAIPQHTIPPTALDIQHILKPFSHFC